MRRIALTGGIGSGKSFVCKVLEKKGINVYDCDKGAKTLMREDEHLKSQLISLIGPETYIDGELNKAVVAKFLLASENNKQAINSIVHPAVIKDFYSSEMQWMESAILFEANLQNTVDVIVCVSAPEDVRIERVMHRDGISKEKARQWIGAQMSQEEKEKLSDFIIINDGIQPIEPQIEKIIFQLEKKV